MYRTITRAALALLTTGALVAIPATALASSDATTVAHNVQQNYAQQLGARERLAGYRLVGTSVRCAPANNGTAGAWTCYAKFTAAGGGARDTFGVWIDASHRGYAYHTVGRPSLVG